jgi:hypothetical protein
MPDTQWGWGQWHATAQRLASQEPHYHLTHVPPPACHLPLAAGLQPKPVRMYLSPATAIFMPSPLIQQWELQLRQHTNAQLRVLVYPQDCEWNEHSRVLGSWNCPLQVLHLHPPSRDWQGLIPAGIHSPLSHPACLFAGLLGAVPREGATQEEMSRRLAWEADVVSWRPAGACSLCCWTPTPPALHIATHMIYVSARHPEHPAPERHLTLVSSLCHFPAPPSLQVLIPLDTLSTEWRAHNPLGCSPLMQARRAGWRCCHTA